MIPKNLGTCRSYPACFEHPFILLNLLFTSCVCCTTLLKFNRSTMQRSVLQQHGTAAAMQRRQCLAIQHRRQPRCHAATNGNGHHQSPSSPSPAETARTILDLASEGTLSSITSSGWPIGTPVSYTLGKDGTPTLHIPANLASSNSSDMQQLGAEAKCSLMVQPTTPPARAVAAVSLSGTAQHVDDSEGHSNYLLKIERCTYFGGLDNVSLPSDCC